MSAESFYVGILILVAIVLFALIVIPVLLDIDCD